MTQLLSQAGLLFLTLELPAIALEAAVRMIRAHGQPNLRPASACPRMF
jgi:hypothetical protein